MATGDRLTSPGQLDADAIRRARRTAGATDRGAAEEYLRLLYEHASLRAPVIEWVTSPLAGCRLHEERAGSLDPIARDFEHSSWNMDYRPSGGEDPFALPSARLGLDTPSGDPDPREPAYAQVLSALGLAGYRDAHRLMRPGQFDDIPEARIRESALGVQSRWGELDGYDEQVLPLRALLSSVAGPWWAFHEFAIVSDKPLFMNVNEIGRLEAHDGPALRYADGWTIWARPEPSEPEADATVPNHARPHPTFNSHGELSATADDSWAGSPQPVEVLPESLAEYRASFIATAVSTERTDRREVEELVSRVYQERSLDHPEFLWVESPRAGVAAWHLATFTSEPLRNRYRRGEFGSGLRRDTLALEDPFGLSTRWLRAIAADAEVALAPASTPSREDWRHPDLSDRFATVADSSLHMLNPSASLRTGLERALRSELTPLGADSVDLVDPGKVATLAQAALGARWADLTNQVGAVLAAEAVGRALHDAVSSVLSVGPSIEDAVHAMNSPAWDPVHAVLGIYADQLEGSKTKLAFGRVRRQQLTDRVKLARSGCTWWAIDGLAIACDRPTTIALDEDSRLHSPTGPALVYEDGWSVWAWHGVVVPRSAIEQPEAITAAQILNEGNQEIRRILVERAGYERLIQETEAQQIAHDEAGTLWEIPIRIGWRSEPTRVVEVINSTPEPDGSQRHYFLRVPPDIETAHEAVAWTFGLGGREYAPGIES